MTQITVLDCGCKVYPESKLNEFAAVAPPFSLVDWCPKHANVEKLIAVCEAVAKLPTFHGICTCRYCAAFNLAKATLKELEVDEEGEK